MNTISELRKDLSFWLEIHCNQTPVHGKKTRQNMFGYRFYFQQKRVAEYFLQTTLKHLQAMLKHPQRFVWKKFGSICKKNLIVFLQFDFNSSLLNSLLYWTEDKFSRQTFFLSQFFKNWKQKSYCFLFSIGNSISSENCEKHWLVTLAKLITNTFQA